MPFRDMDPSFGKLLPTNLGCENVDIGCGWASFMLFEIKGLRETLWAWSSAAPSRLTFLPKDRDSYVLLVSD